MRKILKNTIVFCLIISLFIQSSDFSFVMYANTEKNTIVWTDETTDEILEMLDRGLELSSFLEGDLVKDISKQDLLRWKEEGKDINDIVLERARKRSNLVIYDEMEPYVWEDNENDKNTPIYSQTKKYLASPDSDGKYYLTDCFLPDDKGNVNLSGTTYADALFNPKTGGTGTSTPWYITLGGDEAMCVSYEGSATSIGKSHHYMQADINHLKNNAYFKGGSNYPVEDYLKGACYAYERLLGAQKQGSYSFYMKEGTLDANYKELERKIGPSLLMYTGRDINQAVLQIITWRIAQGSFDPDDLTYEHDLATTVFGQMYDQDSGYGASYADKITAFYDFYALCAKEAASGNYQQKYSTVQIKYWEVQGSDSDNWQDFITWDAGKKVPVKESFEITKYGKIISDKYTYPNAEFAIYSDNNCTNKIGEFTTDSNGSASIDIIEGIYYLKETKEPTGTVKSDKTITLTVVDSTFSSSVTNEEIYNSVVFQKTSSLTNDVVPVGGQYALYEYIAGKDTYMKLCDFSYVENGFTNEKGIKISDHSYILTDTTSSGYHNSDGSIAKIMTGSWFYYTPVNEGKFKIVEEEAPAGYKKNTEDYKFTMDLSVQGKMIIIPKNRIKDDSYRAGVKIAKYDALSAQKLDGVSFGIQEQIDGIWYDVGKLVYDETEEVYKTSSTEKYFIHDSNGSISQQVTSTSFPLYNSTANEGKYRIVETEKQNENYVNTYTKEFRVRPTKDHQSYEFIVYDNGLGVSSASNIGKSISVKIAKYDSITSEELTNADLCTLSVYEYNHVMGEWQKVGSMEYNDETGLYETSSRVMYLPHKEDGALSSASIGSVYIPGMLYYTSVNEGDYKVVETVNPTNYLNGKLNDDMEIETFEKTFKINHLVSNKEVIDMSQLADGAKDTGIYLNVELSKYDNITKEKITNSEAMFTVYENVNGNWLEMGKLKYDATSNIYQTADNVNHYVYHNSEGNIVSPGSALAGLHYTTANKGRFKITETGAPKNYLLGSTPYEKEFSFDDAKDGVVELTDMSKAAADLGIKGTVSVKKYDAVTSEMVKSTDMTATVYEKIDGNWYEMGNLVYDAANKTYTGEGVSFQFHNSDGTQTDTSGIKDFEAGRLYYTTANKGQFKIVETAAPTFYTLIHPEISTKYTKEFSLTSDNQKFEFYDETEAIKNFGITVIVKVNKYDVITNDYAPSKDAVFVIQEYLIDQNSWVDTVTLVYDKTEDVYTTAGQTVTIHKPDKSPGYQNSEGKLYYTTQNSGRYRILEKSAPSFYVNGSKQYVKEFNLTKDAVGDIINLTSIEQSAKNLGIYETVSVKKFDRITSEEVEKKDAIFTVYEKVNGQWLEAGILKYNKTAEEYACDGVSFIFHNVDGTNVDPAGITDFEIGRLYYTSANHGQFKIKETKPPTNYTNESLPGETSDVFEKEFIIDTDKEINNFNSLNDAAKNIGRYTYVDLLKYDTLTKKNVEFKNAEFQVEEYVNGEWIAAAQLKYNEESGIYSTRDTEVKLHNSSGDEVYSAFDGKLYYTTANKGRYRVRETKPPTNYTLARFVKELNVLDGTNELIDLTKQVDGPNDPGNFSTVEVAKFDSVTNEPVRTKDTEFTVYEYIEKMNRWMKSGVLVYDDEARNYVSKNVQFKFHDENGSEINTTTLPEFKTGRLYYTTANKGKFKVVETGAPQYYTNGTFSKEFTVSTNGQVFSYTTKKTGAMNKGVGVMLKVQKYDVLTKQKTILKDAVFEVQEHIADLNQWVTVGKLIYDEEAGCYTLKDQNLTYHTSAGTEAMKEKENRLTYTSANLGVFRVIEAEPPTNYEESLKQYCYEFDITKDSVKDENGNDVIDLTDLQKAAKNLGKSGIVKVAKYDSITKEKVLTGDAEFTVYEYIENIDRWLETGILVYDEEKQEYLCDGIDFVFHNENGELIDLQDIPDYEPGRLYYTTANLGKFKVAETNAPKHYRIDGFEKEFDLTDHLEVSYNTALSAAYDTGIRSIVELVKADSLTKEKLAGAKFALQEWSEFHQTWLTVGTLSDNGDGTYTTEGMEISLHTGKDSEIVSAKELLYTTQNLGKYRILETQPPLGYINDLYVSDILTAEEDFEVIKLTSEDLEATDTPIRVGISKTSVADGKMINGATLTVKDWEGNVIDTWVTDGTEHILSAIPAGKYILAEERAAKGYIVAEQVEFEVTETNEIQKVTMVDEEVKGRIIIHKTDKVTGKELAGAKFEIRDELGRVIETLLTDENGYAKSNPISFGIYDDNGTYKGSKKYTIVEVTAPSGYEPDRTPVEIIFEYQDDQTPIVEKVVEIKNDKTPVTVKTGDSMDMAEIILALIAVIGLIASVSLLKSEEEQ